MFFNNPLSIAKAERLIEILDLSPGDGVLDAGCGTGEFLIRLVEHSGTAGIGIDCDPDSIAIAREAAANRLPDGACKFLEKDVAEADLDSASFDAALCLGSTHAFGSGESAFPNALRELTGLVRTGGQILIGEGYWKRPPDPEYLEFIGEPVGIYHDHAGNIALAETKGLIPIDAAVSNHDEWDDFEWSHKRKIEKEAALNPDDPSIVEKLERSRAWRNAYLRWGRDTMGFGFYLFRKP